MEILDHSQYVEMTMHFRCNLKCEHCMIENTMDWLEPESIKQFKEILAYNNQHHRWKGIILTGSEVTLRRDLPELIEMARDSGFERVRIQTNAIRLADNNYCQKLIEAGVNEFFVSVLTADIKTYDNIAGLSGAYERTLAGLENIDRYDGVILITNTVITNRSYRYLPKVVKLLNHLRNLVQFEFWSYFPMKEVDDKDLLVPHELVVPYVREAISLAKNRGCTVEVKNFPECLLNEDREALNNAQPQLFIDEAFWTEFMRNGFYQCIHKEQCGSTQCLGLNTAYIKKYGHQENILTPLPKINSCD